MTTSDVEPAIDRLEPAHERQHVCLPGPVGRLVEKLLAAIESFGEGSGAVKERRSEVLEATRCRPPGAVVVDEGSLDGLLPVGDPPLDRAYVADVTPGAP